MTERIDNIKAGAKIHAGDGGYRIGNQEDYEKFVEKRNLITREKAEEYMGVAKPAKIGQRHHAAKPYPPSAWRKSMKYWVLLWIGIFFAGIFAGVLTVLFNFYL